MHKSILLAILPLAAFAAKEPHTWPVTGVVTEECAVAVSVNPMLYSATTQGREDALRSELRIRDSKGRDIPYAFRAAKTRVVDEANHSVSFVAAPPMDVLTACTVETDSKAKKTVLETAVFGLPMTAIAINATDRNFSRKVAVFRRMDARWHPLASGRISAVNLPGEKRRSLEIGFGREVRESELRIEIGNDDNPPLSLDDLPVSFKVTRYDVVFIAEPDESYSLVVVNGAERPRYDEAILGYVDRVQDPVRFEIKLPLYDGVDVLNGENGPTAVWLAIPSRVIIQIVSVIVFIVLGIICFRLFKSTSADGT
ncbi:MAG: hypothetical protein E7049_12030 [Lentisphaerae bacterium]|nr:hypothetical protein [Lentisphaerota bacterium]